MMRSAAASQPAGSVHRATLSRSCTADRQQPADRARAGNSSRYNRSNAGAEIRHNKQKTLLVTMASPACCAPARAAARSTAVAAKRKANFWHLIEAFAGAVFSLIFEMLTDPSLVVTAHAWTVRSVRRCDAEPVPYGPLISTAFL